LRDEAMTIFLAGHETTANALAWLMYLLSENPDEVEKIANEVNEVLGERTPTAEDVRNLKYTSQAIEEGMRLYPPAWIFGRKSKDTDKLGEYEIPGGSDIMICSYILQRSPEFWEDPEKFDPERFSEENSKARPRYHYFPFGGGQRFCIGNNFAMMEMILIVAMVVQRFRLKLVPGHIVERNHLVTLRPKYGIKMTVHGA
ncbi:MAG: cytochrome P450, partial [Bacteroidia bacterium]|nr:cytochrome P450 [Bacteroidia bacterium]